MTDECPDLDSGDDEKSEASSDAEVINGDAGDTKDTVAHDTQMRYSPSFLPENTQVCVETDVNRPLVMEGTQLRSVQQTATQATRQASESELKRAVSQAFKTSCTVVPDSVVAVQEYLSDVCDEVVKDEQHKNQRGLFASVMESRLSPSPALNRIQCSRHVSLCQTEVERTRTPWRRLRCRVGRPTQSPQFPRKPRQSQRQ